MIWYRRNAAVTTIVDTAANSASAAGNVAETVVSSAGSVVSTAGSMAGNMLQPLVFDPLRRLQGGENDVEKNLIDDSKRLWIAVDGMGGDNAPGQILDGCLQALQRLPICIKFVGESELVLQAAEENQLKELLDEEIAAGLSLIHI